MRGFFWIIIAIYVFLYFYAVWLYEEFSIWMALAMIMAIGLQVYFIKKRKETRSGPKNRIFLTPDFTRNPEFQ